MFGCEICHSWKWEPKQFFCKILPIIHIFLILDANIFQAKFEDAKKILLTDCDLYNGKVDEEIKKEIVKAIEENEDEKDEDETKEISEKLSELEVNNKNPEIETNGKEE